LKATRVILLSNAHKTSVEQAASEFGVEKALLKSSCTPGQLLAVINELFNAKPVEPDSSDQPA
jgi:DNA-binding NarL/FixJ family response regulator